MKLQSKHEYNSAMIGMLLGDSYICELKNGYGMYIRHGGNQLSLVDDKVACLNAYLKPQTVAEKIDKKGYVYKYAYYNNASLKYLYENIYKNKVKIITKSILNRFNHISLAFFYMDDGSLSLRKYINKEGVWNGSYKSKEITLCVHNFSIDEITDFKQMLKEKFDLTFNIAKDGIYYRLWCNTKNTLKFIKIVEPIISSFKCVNYKIDLKT